MLVWILISIILLPLLLILALPFSFAVQAGRNGEDHFAASLSWLWGALSLKTENKSGTLSAGPFAVKKFNFKWTGTAEKNRKKPEKNGKSFFDTRQLNAALITTFYKLLRQVWAALHIRIEGSALFGFADPALTGLAYGLLSAAGLAARQPGLTLTPDFLNPVFTCRLTVRGRFTVGKLLYIAIKFILSRPVRRLWWPWPRRKEVSGKWRKSTLPTT